MQTISGHLGGESAPFHDAPDPRAARNRAGQGALRFELVGGRTVVHTARANSPLRLLTPKNHGDAAWTFVSNFGGGLVDGDALAIDVRVGDGARALVGTQASTKVYRSPRGCSQRLDASVGNGGLLVLLPDPVTCFAEARYEQQIHIQLDAGASLIAIDTVTSGRAARGERWDFARYVSRMRIVREGRPWLFDSLLLDPNQGDLRTRMGRFDVFATIIALGPCAALVRGGLLESCFAPVSGDGIGRSIVRAASPIGDDGAIARIAATRVELATNAIRALLEPLDRELGDNPFARKW